MTPPIYKAKNGQFSAAIFENPKGKSISLQKGYTDKEGNWQNQTITLFPRNVDTVIEVLQEAKKQCENPSQEAPEEGAASSSSSEKIELPGGDELVIEEDEEEIDETGKIKNIFKLRFPDAAEILESKKARFKNEAANLWTGFKAAWQLMNLRHIDFREDIPVCSQCGKILENLNITANETGCFYCSNDCAKENVKENAPEGGY